ncbi:LOW QUALITY PROTEIN: glycine receptor subunit alpha-2-like [Pomacea canaliculata]|uniref:LOW QUALITY PROTEIN: glycine receptor subunit alpha-2-like n=1 Tax=Pomacea canaliculata TaxID=400727 RepID=UPI000D7386E6|nr:LOW QUALITY PROTEIN: glycine receptor subunit alpha-2-like [Pomacea canaliculata]
MVSTSDLPCLMAVLSLSLGFSPVTAKFENMTRRQVLHSLLDDPEYDPQIPPDFDKDVPTNVTIQIHILSFHTINEVSMDYTMTFYLRRKWVDERLAFTSFPGAEVLELDTRVIDKLWVPDIYFRNEKSASVHNVTVPNRLLHLHKNGTVLYSSRLSMTLSCQMDLTLFPLDVQSCPLIIQSYSYTTANVDFQWTQADGKVTKADDLEMARFIDAGVITADCIGMYESQFACIMATFMLKRHVGYFLVHMFLPSVLVVILSWVSFWIDSAATPRRITIGVMSILTMTTQSSGVQAILPRVSYIKAIDVWMSTCVAFVFAALLEYAYVNTLSRQEELFRRDVRDSNSRKQDTEVLETLMPDTPKEPESSWS